MKPEELGPAAVDIEKDLWDVGREGAEDAGKSWCLVSLDDQAAHDFGNFLLALAAARLKPEVEAAGRTKTRYGRWVERHDGGGGYPAKIGAETIHDRVDAFLSAPAFAPGFQRCNHHSGVRAAAAHHAIAGNADRIRNPWCPLQDPRNGIQRLLCPLERSGIGQLHIDKKVSLILARHESGRKRAEQSIDPAKDRQKNYRSNPEPPGHAVEHRDVPVAREVEASVECPKNS